MQTYCIHIKGIVQGVGFRPFIYRLAQKYHLQGEVSNGTGGVHFFFNGNASLAKTLVNEITVDKPTNAIITSIDIAKVDDRIYNHFAIANSHFENDHTAICPDFAICNECKEEMMTPTNRRFLYPFITCTKCGPRLSIIQALPYDRDNTSMIDFSMCGGCLSEYEDIHDRRYFSQTNSCHICGVQITLQNNKGESFPFDILTITKALHQGNIIAVKGIGGYLFLCDASLPSAVQLLRSRKNRKSKPFAIMVKNQEALLRIVECQEIKYATITSAVAPIVICRAKDKKNGLLDYDGIAPGLDYLGVMIPNTGLLVLIAEAYPHPLVCTSANISGSPIYHKEETMKRDLSHIYDLLLSHNRGIVMPQDDSVMKFSHFYNQQIILRRSRGLAPNVWTDISIAQQQIQSIAVGADLKNTFALTIDDNLYLSQYLGDQSSYETQQAYKEAVQHYTQLISTEVKEIVMDSNPMYFVNAIAKDKWSDRDVTKIQHHKAHFYSVLIEHGLIDTEQRILGIVWDGVGYGDDHQIWGGEFFEYTDMKMNRVGHFEYFDNLLGDAMSLQPRIAALAFLYDDHNRHDLVRKKFTDKEWQYYSKLIAQPSKVKTCSVGRIFDAIASILDIIDSNDYEGQAAMMLEQYAMNYYLDHGLDAIEKSYTIEISNDNVVSLHKLKQDLLSDVGVGEDKEFIAAKFHYSLVKVMARVAEGYDHIAMSGGVFQNGLLIDLAIHHLKEKHTLYFNKSVSPNDENIALGQMAYSLTYKNQQQCA